MFVRSRRLVHVGQGLRHGSTFMEKLKSLLPFGGSTTRAPVEENAARDDIVPAELAELQKYARAERAKALDAEGAAVNEVLGGGRDEATSLFNELKAQGRRARRGGGVLEEMEAVVAKMQANGQHVGAKEWTILVSACARAGDLERAQSTFDDMRASGIEPDAWTYAALANAHAERGGVGGVQAIIAEAAPRRALSLALFNTLFKACKQASGNSPATTSDFVAMVEPHTAVLGQLMAADGWTRGEEMWLPPSGSYIQRQDQRPSGFFYGPFYRAGGPLEYLLRGVDGDEALALPPPTLKPLPPPKRPRMPDYEFNKRLGAIAHLARVASADLRSAERELKSAGMESPPVRGGQAGARAGRQVRSGYSIVHKGVKQVMDDMASAGVEPTARTHARKVACYVHVRSPGPVSSALRVIQAMHPDARQAWIEIRRCIRRGELASALQYFARSKRDFHREALYAADLLEASLHDEMSEAARRSMIDWAWGAVLRCCWPKLNKDGTKTPGWPVKANAAFCHYLDLVVSHAAICEANARARVKVEHLGEDYPPFKNVSETAEDRIHEAAKANAAVCSIFLRSPGVELEDFVELCEERGITYDRAAAVQACEVVMPWHAFPAASGKLTAGATEQSSGAA
jgi:pentatricopeptide repeat protein